MILLYTICLRVQKAEYVYTATVGILYSTDNFDLETSWYVNIIYYVGFQTWYVVLSLYSDEE